MTVKASTYGKGRAALHKALSKRESFVTGGAFKGTAYGDHKPEFAGTQLSGDDLTAWAMDHNSVTYVVWSYATPIAWDTISADGSRHTHTVEQRFSRTTSRHQGMLYML